MPLPSLSNHSSGQPPHFTPLKRVQNRPFQKVNHPGISRIIFPTGKGTGENKYIAKDKEPPFQTGNLQNCLEQWTRITDSPLVLDVIRGHRIQFHTQPLI